MKQLLALVAIAGCCGEPATEFTCAGNASCRNGDVVGVCEENGFCSFEDASCPEGRRFGEFAGNALGDACVESSPPAIGSWKSSMTLPVGRYSLGLATEGTSIFAVGGIAGSDPKLESFSADVTDGLMTWASRASLPVGRRSLAAAAHDGFVYAIAGHVEGDPISASVLSMPFDGASWTATASLPGGVRCAGVAQNGDKVYVVGGKTGGQLGVTDVQIGTMNAGSISWTAGTPMMTQRFCHGAAIARDYLYAIAGGTSGMNSSAQVTAEVEFAKIEDDGSLGAWQPTTPLPAARWHLTAVGNDHYLVAIGGTEQPSVGKGDVFVAHVNADGSLGAWRVAPALVNGGSHNSAVRVGDQVFYVGSETEIATLRPAPL